MLKFFLKIFVFLLPVSIFFALPAAVMFFGREYVSVVDIVQTQKYSPNAIFGFSYAFTPIIPYKKLLIENQRPKVIALGTSRVMQIRKEFFANPTEFVNAGGAARNLAEAKLFIQELPKEGGPKLVILGVDQELLYADNSSPRVIAEDSFPTRVTATLSLMFRRIYLDYLSGKYTLAGLLDAHRTRNSFGLSALINGDGFRYDRSYRYYRAEHDPGRMTAVNLQIADSVAEIGATRRALSASDKQNLNGNLQTLSEILMLAEAKGIVIVGFVPPRPTKVYNAMSDSNGYYQGLLAEGPGLAKQVFALHRMTFFDFSSLTSFGGRDSEFVDAVHGTDGMYLKIMHTMSKGSKDLALFVNTMTLDRMESDLKGDFLQF